MDTPVFHDGEIRAQALAGGGAAGNGIRAFMPDQHREFFPLLPAILLGVPGAGGQPIATILTGAPGFVSSPDPTTLRIAAAPPETDPAAGFVRPGRPLGLLGLDLGTRRRNRANGVIAAADASGLTLAVTQSFGNCAKYIQKRQVRATTSRPGAVERLSGLDAEAAALIRGADTFFVATGVAGLDKGVMDVSHRGGRPGFVQVAGDTLAVPDFRGNRFYNTLGNLLADPRAGLLFIGFDSGDLLHLEGVVDIDWTPEGAVPAGTERLWRFRTTGALRRRGALPLRWDLVEASPATLETGAWAPPEARHSSGLATIR